MLEIFMEKIFLGYKTTRFFMSSGYLMTFYVQLAYLLSMSCWLNTITNVVK